MKKKGSPTRNIMFLSLTAEEHGLLGAFWYTMHPVLPLNDAIANINFDIGNLYGQTKDMIGLGSEKSELGRYSILCFASISLNLIAVCLKKLAKQKDSMLLEMPIHLQEVF